MCGWVGGQGMRFSRCERRVIRRRCTFSSFLDAESIFCPFITGIEADDFLCEGKILPLFVYWICTAVRVDFW
jgi:hypothetical protein